MPPTPTLLSRTLRALDSQEGSMLVGYSSLMLLVAIAALTLLATPSGAPPAPPGSPVVAAE